PASLPRGRAAPGQSATTAFLFPGQGVQQVGSGTAPYRQGPLFREALDRCAARLEPLIGRDIRDLLYPSAAAQDDAAAALAETCFAQPALFALEYAVAESWRGWGVRPQAMLGHSLGEYVAACIAGTFALDDALALISARGRLMQQTAAGGMLAIGLAEEQAAPS